MREFKRNNELLRGVILAVFISIMAMLMVGQMATFAKASDEDFVIDENGVLRGYNGAGGDIVIPEGVTVIGMEAFYGCKGLTSVVIPEGVTIISGFAFLECTSLTDVVMPSGLKIIGGGAFERCTSLLNIEIPQSVRTIEPLTFFECSSLQTITFHKGVKSIGEQAFEGCSSLVTVELPESITVISERTFAECSKLKNIIIPDGVTQIKEEAFFKCVELEIDLLNSVDYIGNGAFAFCSSIENLIMPMHVNIGDYAFGNCSNLETVILWGGSIGDGAFSGCISLREVSFYYGSSIGSWAFSGCTNLIAIELPGDLCDISEYCFKSIENPSIRPDGVVIYGCENSYVESYAFRNSIPFVVMDALQNFSVEYSMHFLRDGVLTHYTGTLEDVVIPRGLGIVSIGRDAFFDNATINSVVIPEGVTRIGESAFVLCENLSSVVIPDSLITIEGAAFSGCRGLNSILLPNSLSTIESHSFFNCSSLPNIVIPNSVTIIGSNAFYGCTGMTDVVIPSGVTTIGIGAFADCCGLESISLSNTVSEIGDGAFFGCNKLKDITIPESVTHIGVDAFYNIGIPVCVYNNSYALLYCLEKNVPYTVLSDGEDEPIEFVIVDGILYAYLGEAETYVIPEDVTQINANAFATRSNLKNIVIHDNVVKIADNAFRPYENNITFHVGRGTVALDYCLKKNLTFVIDSRDEEFVIKDNVLIGYYGNSKDVVVPSHVSRINNNAFYGCTGIENITIYGEISVSQPDVIWLANATFHIDAGSAFIIQCVEDGVKFDINHHTEKFIINEEGELAGYYGTDTEVVIPEGITGIAHGAFYGRTDITSVVIPEGTYQIGYYAFMGCSNLTSIEMPDSLIHIWFGAFRDCTELNNIVIKNTLRNVWPGAFSGCTKLNRMTLMYTGEGWGPMGDDIDSLITDIIISDNITVLQCYMYDHWWKYKNLNRVVFSRGVQEIRYGDGLVIPNAVFDNESGEYRAINYYGYKNSAIEDYCFSWRSDVDGGREYSFTRIFDEGEEPDYFYIVDNILLKYYDREKVIDIPSDVSRIKEKAFYNCKKVYEVNVPESVQKMDDYAFYYCRNLVDITINNPNMVFGEFAFDGCPRELVIHGYVGSTAEEYARDYHITFEPIIDISQMKRYAIEGCSASLSDIINLVFYYDITADEIETNQVVASIVYRNGKEVSASFSKDVFMECDGKRLYGINCPVPAKEVNDVISIRLWNTFYDAPCSDVKDYSVKDYFEALMENEEEPIQERALIEAILTYAAYSQVYFGYQTDSLAKDLNERELSSVEKIRSVMPGLAAFNKQGELPDGISYYGCSLVLNSSIEYRLYFEIDNPLLAAEYGFISSNMKNLYYLENVTVSIMQLHEVKEYRVGNAVIRSNPFDYIKKVSDGQYSKSLTDLTIAIYDYYDAAWDYWYYINQKLSENEIEII